MLVLKAMYEVTEHFLTKFLNSNEGVLVAAKKKAGTTKKKTVKAKSANRVAPKLKAKAKKKLARKITKTAKSTLVPMKPMQKKIILRRAPALEQESGVVDMLDSTAENTTNDV